jgi:hypothetical protein
MLEGVDTTNADVGQALCEETEAGRQDRSVWEVEGIAVARVDVAAGRLVDAVRVRGWADSLSTGQPLPVPYSGC